MANNSTKGPMEDMSYVYEYSLIGVFSHPLPVEMVISTILWTMSFLATAGNILVFVGILGDRRLRSIAANMYILNLASADFFVGLVSLPVFNIWRYYGNFPFGRAICTLWIIVDYAASNQSVFAICLISMDRYFMVTKFHEYQKYSSGRLAGSLIAATWTVAILFNWLPVLGNDLWPNVKDTEEVNYSVICDFKVLYIVSYNISQYVTVFFIPVIILTYFNLKVYSNILQRSRGLKRTIAPKSSQPASTSRATEQTKQSALSKGNPSTITNGPAGNDAKKTFKKHRKAAITLGVIVGSFVVLWIPYYILQFFYVLDKVKFSWLLWNSVYYTVWCNSAINPLLYAATSPPIRRRFLQVLCFWNSRALRKIQAA